MKTNIVKSFCFLAACLVLAGCEEKFGEGVTLKDIQTGEDVRVNMGDKVKAQAWPVPWDCTDYKFTWESADPTIATVDNYGKITPVDVGNTVVYVSQGSIKKEIPVEVYEITLQEKLVALGVKGLWLFEDASNLFKASAGKDLMPVGTGFTQVDGPSKRKKAVSLPCSEKIDGVWQHNHLICEHGFAPNGGGAKYVNEFTIVVDCKFPGGPTETPTWQNGKYYSLYQTYLDNSSDADFFWRPGGDFGITGSYTGKSKDGEELNHLFVKDTWYRFVIVVKLGNELKYYMNGVAYDARSQGSLDGERAWRPEGVLLFADEDGENGQGFPLIVSAVGIFDKALTEVEAKSLGGL
ncbi:hypothetical protein AGMMS4957_00160 [Bacteroidia bacterium]|nr:hypothetical protein AGMMS4957_00160 [Bacteroidia bacterium]